MLRKKLQLLHNFQIIRKYHDLGLQLLNVYFDEDQLSTRKLLCSDRLESPKKRTPLDIAAEIENEEFVAHSSSQDLLNQKWSKFFELKDDSKIKVIFLTHLSEMFIRDPFFVSPRVKITIFFMPLDFYVNEKFCLLR